MSTHSPIHRQDLISGGYIKTKFCICQLKIQFTLIKLKAKKMKLFPFFLLVGYVTAFGNGHRTFRKLKKGIRNPKMVAAGPLVQGLGSSRRLQMLIKKIERLYFGIQEFNC